MSTSLQPPSSSRTSFRVTLSNDQIHQILRAAQEDPRLQDLYDVVSIISLTGLRARELENLLWADVDLANGQLAVASPKAISKRYVPIGARTHQVLEARLARQPASEYVLGICPKTLLCRVRRQLAELGQQIGIGSVNLRNLRHIFFSNLMNNGASPIVPMAIGGFSWR
jgi:integrase